MSAALAGFGSTPLYYVALPELGDVSVQGELITWYTGTDTSLVAVTEISGKLISDEVFRDLGKTIFWDHSDYTGRGNVGNTEDVRKVISLRPASRLGQSAVYVPLGTRVKANSSVMTDAPGASVGTVKRCYIAKSVVGTATL
jgi:hypothetical protein